MMPTAQNIYWTPSKVILTKSNEIVATTAYKQLVQGELDFKST